MISSDLRQAAFRHFLLLAFVPLPAAACSGRLHVELKDSGVYALDYAAIAAAQPGLKDCRADDLVLLNRDQEVPIRVTAGSGGTFGPGGRIEWLGQRLHGPQSWFDQYSNVNVYQLAASPGQHARLREVAAAAGGSAAELRRHLHFEQENLLIRLGGDKMRPGDEPDVWQWAKLTPIDPKPFAFDFDLPDADLRGTRAAAVELTLNFRGESNVIAPAKGAKAPDHVIEVSINGRKLQTLTWDGRAEQARTLSVPAALLQGRHNSLGLSVPRRDAPADPANFIVDVVMFNWMEIGYPIAGNLNAGDGSFAAASSLPIELGYTGADAPVLFGTDGTYRRTLAAGAGRWRAAAAAPGIDLFPQLGSKASIPALVRAVADGDLRAGDSGSDYLMVAHPRLLLSIEPLASYHRIHGLSVAVLDVDDIYDQFNGGIVHPRAIRDFVAYGMQHWRTKPRFLLLVGDASFDIHHDLRSDRPNARQYAIRPEPLQNELLTPGGLSAMATTPYAQWDPELPNRNLIPTWQVPSAEGQSASDNGFAALKDGDFHPQLAVGRLPVVEPAEVRTIVDKTVGYLADPAPGPWRRDVLFVSTSEVPNYKQDSDAMAAGLLRQGFAVKSLYTDFNEKDASKYSRARETLKEDLDAGNLLVHFIGHGGQFIWRVGPIGDLFGLPDVGALRNAGRYPMVLAMTCFSAPFDHPTEDSIGERFLREAGKGAVAVFAASWSNWPNPAYSKLLVERLLRPGVAIGDAIVATKAEVKDRTFVEMYNLLGDPALVLARPRGELRLARAADRWDARVIVRVPASDFAGNVAVDWLDARGAVVQSRNYEARDAQFMLPVPDQAMRVSVYTADTRNGSTALGSLDLNPPALPPPPPRAKLPPAPVVPHPHAPPTPDTLYRGDFGDPE